jgi:hypothetical protein
MGHGHNLVEKLIVTRSHVDLELFDELKELTRAEWSTDENFRQNYE